MEKQGSEKLAGIRCPSRRTVIAGVTKFTGLAEAFATSSTIDQTSGGPTKSG
jgi:hypothetical protein